MSKSKSLFLFPSTVIPAVLGLALLTGLPQQAFAQDDEDPPTAECSICWPVPELGIRICLPFVSGAEGCNYEGGSCNLTGKACNTPLQSLSVAVEDRLVIPADGGNVMLVRLEENIFGSWGCDGELDTAYRDVGNGVVVALTPSELVPYAGRHSFATYSQALARNSEQVVDELP